MSRHPLKPSSGSAAEMAEAYVNMIAETAAPLAIPLDTLRKETELDTELQAVIFAIRSGNWSLPNLKEHLAPYLKIKEELSVTESGFVLRDRRMVIPRSLRQRSIDLAHGGHQGIVKTKSLLREKVWFPGIDSLAETTVSKCVPCQAAVNRKERAPLSTTIRCKVTSCKYSINTTTQTINYYKFYSTRYL